MGYFSWRQGGRLVSRIATHMASFGHQSQRDMDYTAPRFPETGFRKPRRYRDRSRDRKTSRSWPHQRCAIPEPPPDSTLASERRRRASATFGAGTIIDVRNATPSPRPATAMWMVLSHRNQTASGPSRLQDISPTHRTPRRSVPVTAGQSANGIPTWCARVRPTLSSGAVGPLTPPLRYLDWRFAASPRIPVTTG